MTADAANESWFTETLEVDGSTADASLWDSGGSTGPIETRPQAADDDWGALVPSAQVPVLTEAEPELFELSPEDAQEVAPIELKEADAASLEEARKRAQQELIREMQEALRRSGASTGDEWLDPAPEVPTSSSPTLAEIQEDWGAAVTPPPVLTPQVPEPLPEDPWQMRAPAPLVLGGKDATSPSEDLWKVVSFDNSVEAALRNVEVPAPPADEAVPAADLPVEAEIEATFEATFEASFDAPFDATFEPLPFDDGDDDLAQDPSDPAEAARLRRQRLLRRAMENMGTMAQRPMTGAQPVVQAPPAPAAPASPPPVERASDEEARLAEKIQERAAKLRDSKDRDHFAILGLGREATRDQVKAAFLTLAKVFHPDRLPSSLSHMAAQITSVFESIREAYDVLYEDQQRAAWLAARQRAEQGPQHARPGAPAQTGAKDPAAEALEFFKKGEAAFRKREFLAADEHFGRAFALDRKALHLAAQAWAIYMDPTRRGDASVPKQMMNEALRLDGACDRAHYQLGVIARVENDIERAERHFRSAVAANARHLEANQELRLIEMRKKNAPKKGGFFR